MAIRDKLRSRVQPLLEPGEQIERVFPAQSGPNPNLLLLTYLVFFFTKYFVVVVTDKRVAILKAGAWMPAKPSEIVESMPHGTRLGPVSGTLWSKISLSVSGKPLWVHRRFYKDVEGVDGGDTRVSAGEVATPAPSAELESAPEPSPGSVTETTAGEGASG